VKQLMEGSEAIVESALVAGCKFFAGYPMTPFTEVLEHFARRLPEVGGVCVNAESEIEAVNMAWGALSTGARAATGSTGQGLALMQEAFSEICRSQLPLVVVNMARGQSEYYQATRGGGHGDYRHIVLAPSTLAEAIELTQLAFHLADKWTNPVQIYGDYYLAHTAESVEIVKYDFGPLPQKDWKLDGTRGGTGHSRLVTSIGSVKGEGTEPDMGAHLAFIADKYGPVAEVEQRAELFLLDDADWAVVTFGTAARFVRPAVLELRAEGLKVGMYRPITLWPFPGRDLAALSPRLRSVLVFETNAGQMVDDVKIAVFGAAPVTSIGGLSADGSAFGLSPMLTVPEVKRRILQAATEGARA
jgi:2-oxoglutarate ferredoxin oxidoreductase subunit alpha